MRSTRSSTATASWRPGPLCEKVDRPCALSPRHPGCVRPLAWLRCATGHQVSVPSATMGLGDDGERVRGWWAMVDDPRFAMGLLNLSDAARYLGVPNQTFHPWARGYEAGQPLLHVLQARSRAATVTFVALAESYVLEALREAGVRLRRIRPA